MVKKGTSALTSELIRKTCLRSKRSQFKIQQTAFMLVAVTIFFILVAMFVLVFRFSGLKDEARELADRDSMLLVTKLANSPEFSCGDSFGGAKTNCVDLEKIMVLKDKTEYEDFWGVAKIEIRKISPDSEVITILDRDVKALPFVSNFVSLCSKEEENSQIYDKCELAKLMVSSEDRT